MDKKKNAPDNDDLDQFLKEMDDIDKRENSLRMHLNIVSKKMRDSINLDELLKDIEEVRQDMFENQHLLISSPIYETSREYDLSRQTTPANPSQLIEDQASVTNLKPDFQVPEDPEEFLREIEMMNERRKKVHLRMEEVLAMNDKLNEEKARREVKKSAEEKGKGKGDPQEIVQGKLQVFQEMKEHVYDCLPIRHKFRVKALIDFDPRKTYTEEEATSMMFFRKSTSIIVISCFTADWLVGYADLDAKSYSVMKILPSTVIIPHYEALPTPKRTYEILDWESFGSAAEQVDPGAVESLRLSVINKSMHLNHLFRGAIAKPKLVVAAARDFNVDPRIATVLEEKIPLLSFEKGEIIIVTKLANPAKWMEGYVINKPEIRLGLFPATYVYELNIRKSID